VRLVKAAAIQRAGQRIGNRRCLCPAQCVLEIGDACFGCQQLEHRHLRCRHPVATHSPVSGPVACDGAQGMGGGRLMIGGEGRAAVQSTRCLAG